MARPIDVQRRRPVRALVATLLGAVALVGACSPPPSTDAPASASPVAATAEPSPTTAASQSAVACGVQDDEGRLPSDRFVGVEITRGPGSDVVTFVFGEPSSPAPPQGPSSGAIREVDPPFTAAASGLELDVPGEHHVELRFTGMTLVDPSGEPTYDGPTSFRDALPAFRSMERYDASEGQWGWIIGYDGPGCVTLQSTTDRESTVSVVIAHAAG